MAAAAEPAAPIVRFVEVPVIGSDSVQWIDVTVPSSAEDSGEPCAPTTENAAGYAVVGDLPVYLVWRIHKDSPNFLELLELCGSNEFPKCGLRLMFQNALCPFAFVCENKVQGSVGGAYIYVLSVSGFAYLFSLRNLGAYVSGSVFPETDLMVVDLRAQNSQDVRTTRITALPGLLVLGRSDGSVGCFEFGTPVPGSQGSTYELRDVGLSRIWGLVSRTNISSSIWSLALSEVHGWKLLYVLHADGSMRVWDLSGRLKIFSHNLGLPEIAGYHPTRFWVSDANKDNAKMFIAALYGSESGQEVVVVHGLHISFADKLSLTLTSSMRHIVLDEGRLIDLRISCNKLWILKKDGMVFNFFHVELDTGSTYLHSLQEAFLSDQLFQVSEHSIDDLMYASCSISSSMKESSAQIMSSCLLRRLLQPGVYQHAALVASIQNHKHRLINSVTQSVPSDALRKEILSLIEEEGDAANPFSIACSWKRFCSNYFQCWCQNSIPYGLLIDNSMGAVGLIRKNSFSLFRCLEDTEILAYGSFGAFSDFVNSGVNLSNDVLDCEILFKVLNFAGYISQHLGEAAAPVLYESLANPLSISFDDAMSCILKILETGYNLPTTEHYISVFGVDSIWERRQAEHRKQRKFSINSLLSLSALYNKAGSWTRVFNVVENYVKRLVCRKGDVRLAVDAKGLSNINTSLLAVSVSHFARVMFESACRLLFFLGHICNVQGQVQMSFDDLSKIKLDLIPLIQNTLLRWFIIHMLASRPCESLALEDFSYQLSSLHIDNKNDRRLRHDRLGAHKTICCILLLEYPSNAEEHSHLTSRSFVGPLTFTHLLENFVSWVLSGRARDESSFLFSHVIQLAVILIVHNQYEAVESLILTIDASHKKLISQGIQNGDGDWSVCLYLLGFSLLVRAHCSRNQLLKDQKVHEAVYCFFRAAAVEGAYQAFQRLSFPSNLQCPGASSAVAWKLNYYQWVMQFFEQYNLNEAACQFALAALEQVDEVVHLEDELHSGTLSESAATIRGRLWANIFKFNLDLSLYSDAYSAIISNPDEESKHICLRRFIIVLCEHGATELLCDGELPFVGLMEKVEQELVWKAECSDVMGKPNTYKLLYAIQMHRHNWRRAASFMYRYSVRLKKEKTFKDDSHLSLTLEERLHSLAAAVNALHLVHPAYSWIDSHQESYMSHEQHSPNKKARKSINEDVDVDWQFQQQKSYIDIGELENEYVITSAEYLLALANVKLTPAGSHSDLDNLVGLLIQTGLYDMAFTVILRFWKGSEMKRQLERVFTEISECCCLNRNGVHLNSLLLTLSEGPDNHGGLEKGTVPQHTTVHSNWRTLELYLVKYKQLHPRLPITVAETLLHTDPQIDLPLWLIHMFKGERRVTSWGMTGSESDPATLFRLFVDYGRYKEAANLLVEYIESFSSARMANILNCKKMSSVWFPYTAIERLWCELQDLKNSGHMVDQCDKLQKLIHGALLGHLKQVKLDSEDARSYGMVKEQGDKVL